MERLAIAVILEVFLLSKILVADTNNSMAPEETRLRLEELISPRFLPLILDTSLGLSLGSLDDFADEDLFVQCTCHQNRLAGKHLLAFPGEAATALAAECPVTLGP